MEEHLFRMLFYSHDSFGLGHIRRTLAIVHHLTHSIPRLSALIVTGSSIVDRYIMPKNTDYIRFPGITKVESGKYSTRNLGIPPDETVQIREKIISAAVESFRPHVVVVDKSPLGLQGEMMQGLQLIKTLLPSSRKVLGLRDIEDDRNSVIRDWKDAGVYDLMNEHYNEIWVYGNQEVYDPIQEYDLPSDLARKIIFTGYIHRDKASSRYPKGRPKTGGALPTVLVTTGGGEDGEFLLANYLEGIELLGNPPFRSIVISGPFLDQSKKRRMMRFAEALDKVVFLRFHLNLMATMAKADLIVCMGGYNTLCEILSLKKWALVVPRVRPRTEQLIRAGRFQSLDLMEMIHPDEVSPMRLMERVIARLQQPRAPDFRANEFSMDGLLRIENRVKAIVNEMGYSLPEASLDKQDNNRKSLLTFGGGLA
ncbi:MAG: glycosyltransferase [Deltaproteobacteria bacterium]|nr:glycosyltransferase [Deltaproteobacteria bacterium]MBW2307588.1 glycosyltransferase [Deltaproteobacteria bacterium]